MQNNSVLDVHLLEGQEGYFLSSQLLQDLSASSAGFAL